jgi:hypothetical protein
MNRKVKRALFIGLGLSAVTLFMSVSSASAVTQNCFTDVSTGDWFHDFVCWMYDNGLSAGYPDGSFKPTNNITRAESAVLAQRGYELAETNDDDTLAGLSCSTDEIAKWNGSAWVCAADDSGAVGVPAGAVMPFNLPACPVGWSDLTDARGRAITGVPAGGTLGGMVGSALSDLEDRTHTHDVDPAGAGTTSSGSHAHPVNPPSTSSSASGGHNHAVDPPSTGTSSDAHNHRWAYFDTLERWYSYTSGGTSSQLVYDWTDGMTTVGAGVYPFTETVGTSTQSHYTNNDTHSHSVNISSFNSGSVSTHTHAVDIAQFNSGSTGIHSHSVDIPNTASTTASTSDAMPYIQYLMCQKN